MSEPTTRRPNVLFVICDQLRADHLGYAGNSVVRTPNIDALAARGVVFDNAWVANPVCMPNRSTLMTGRMPSAHGVIFNDRSLEWGANTYVRSFRGAGWRTGLFGKSHLQHGVSRNSVMPTGRAAAMTDSWPAGWDTWEDEERFFDGVAPEMPDDFYGFDRAEFAIDHGARVTGHHLLWALERGGRYEDFVVPYSEESPALQRSERWWQVYQPPYGPEFHSTSFVADRTIDFIESATTEGKPWLAWASFPDPHHPVTPPGEWFDRHDAADMVLPETIDDTLEHAPQYLRHMQTIPAHKQRGWVGMFGATDHELVKETIAATYGAIEMIDDAVGQMLRAIDRLGQTDDTVVVFTSDHGDMMGEHGLMVKGFMPYRGVQQVPLLIADPTRPAQRTSSLSGSIDLATTLLDIAGLPAYDGMQGRSLVPIMEDPATQVRDHLLIEDDVPDGLAAVAPIPARCRTVIGLDGTKYTRHSSGEEQLFDLAADPLEASPLLDRDPLRRTHALELLADAMAECDDSARGAPVG